MRELFYKRFWTPISPVNVSVNAENYSDKCEDSSSTCAVCS